MEPFLDLGFFISLAGNVTYKKSLDLQEAAKIIPAHRLLIETDAPYLSPQKVRSKPNHPGHIGYTYRMLAELTETPLAELVAQVEQNFKNFINLSGKVSV